MTSIPPTRLENWLKSRLGQERLSQELLETFQLDLLNETLLHARKNSPFYRQRLKDGPDLPLTDLSRIAELPFTTAEDLRQHHLQMLCVSLGDVARVVTMQTSGTSSSPKRLYFNESDLERTMDFFHQGLTSFVDPGQEILILFPSTKPDSLGDQLKRGASRIPATAHIHWPVLDLESILGEIRDRQIDCLAGAPAQIFALCRHEQYGRRLKPNPLKSVLLSTDYIPQAVADEIRNVWGCSVFEHYGMTEMGLGAALECDAHQGYHLREADLLVEVIDPVTGRPLPPGIDGEVVFTTLARQAMPLIRYRTGDRAAWMNPPCDCGTFLRRLGKVRGRLADLSSTRSPFSMPQLDEAILALPGIYSFQAALRKEGGADVLDLNVFCQGRRSGPLKEEIPAALTPLLTKPGHDAFSVSITTHPLEALRWDSTGMIKRTIG